MRTKCVTNFAMIICLATLIFGCTKTDQLKPEPSPAEAAKMESAMRTINVFSFTEVGETMLEQLPLYTEGSVLTIKEGYKTDGTEELINNALDYAGGFSQTKYSFVIKLKNKSAVYFYPEDELQNDADITELNSWLNGIFTQWLADNHGKLQKSNSNTNPKAAEYLSMMGII